MEKSRTRIIALALAGMYLLVALTHLAFLHRYGGSSKGLSANAGIVKVPGKPSRIHRMLRTAPENKRHEFLLGAPLAAAMPVLSVCLHFPKQATGLDDGLAHGLFGHRYTYLAARTLRL